MMKNYGKLLGTISPETCLKMEYFGSESPKSPRAGGSRSG